jgi:CHAT domain-containing protein
LLAVAILIASGTFSGLSGQTDQTSVDPTQLRQQALDLGRAGKLAEAIAMERRAIALYQSQHGPDDAGLADFLQTLAGLCNSVQDYAGAVAALEQELALLERSTPRDVNKIAGALGSQAAIRLGQGQPVEAAELASRALALQEQLFGKDDDRLGGTLTNLASAQTALGDMTAAAATFERARLIYKSAKQSETTGFATLLNNLGRLYLQMGAFDQAIPAFEECLAIRQRLNVPASAIALVVGNLAAVYQELNQFERAQQLYRQALDTYERLQDPPRLNIAAVSDNLAMIAALRGDELAADQLAQRALDIRESMLGQRHTDVAKTLQDIAVIKLFFKKPADAFKSIERSSEILETNLRSILTSGSEQQRLNYMTTIQENTDIALTIRRSLASDDAAASSWAASVVLRRKGRVLDAMATTMERFASRLSPADRQLLNSLAAARSDLAALVLKPVSGTPEDRDQKIAALAARIDSAEASLAASSRELAVELRPVNLPDLQRAIPADTVLLEYIEYRPFNVGVAGRANRFQSPRYAVFCLGSTGPLQWIELDSAETIDRQVAAVRNALHSPQSTDPKRPARELAHGVFDPIESKLAGARRLLIATDGQLSVVPFGALVDTAGHFLIERFEIDMLASGRDLLRLSDAPASPQPPVIVANPDFNAGAGPAASFVFPALPATAQEASAIQGILPGAQLVTGAAATEGALRQLKGPRVLHIATHGFFLNTAAPPPPAPAGDTRGGFVVVQSNSPEANGRLALIRSGLALSGANHRSGGGTDDGLLTALEAAGLDLRGTQLVVLSACDTGLGEVRTGDGVYGLRRALAVAGAETQVMSLWSADDQATRDLMIAFYKRLQQGEGRAAALRGVQLEMLRGKPSLSHPYYWATFVIAGDWRALRAK